MRKQKSILKTLLRINSIVLCFLFVSCQGDKKQFVPEQVVEIYSPLVANETENSLWSSRSKNVVERVYLEDKNEITFEVEAYDTTFGSDFYTVDIVYSVRNNSDSTLNYLSGCNDLDGCLLFETDSFSVNTLTSCCKPWYIIQKIRPQESKQCVSQFVGEIHHETNIIGIDLRFVDRFISFDSLNDNLELVKDIYRTPTNKNDIIWTKIKPAEDLDFIQNCEPKSLNL